MIQKVLFLFRASPYASACGCRYSRERALGYPQPPTAAPAHRQADKEQNQKAAVGGKKSQIVAPSQPSPRGRRLIAMGSPSPTLPKGREPLLAVFKGVLCGSFPLGKAWDGAPVGLYAPPATLTELRLHSPELRLPSPLGESWRGASAFYLLSHYTKRGASCRFPPTWCGLLARAPRCSLY